MNHYDEKQRKAQRRRNHIAKDLEDRKYRNRIRESNKQHLIDELHKGEMEDAYHFFKKLGFGDKE